MRCQGVTHTLRLYVACVDNLSFAPGAKGCSTGFQGLSEELTGVSYPSPGRDAIAGTSTEQWSSDKHQLVAGVRIEHEGDDAFGVRDVEIGDAERTT